MRTGSPLADLKAAILFEPRANDRAHDRFIAPARRTCRRPASNRTWLPSKDHRVRRADSSPACAAPDPLGRFGRAARASAPRPSAQGAPRRANAIGLKPQARPSPTARCADRQAMRRAASPYKPGESQRQAMPALRKGRKGRSAQATQNPGPDDQSARQVQQTAARRSACACACARGFVGEKACVMERGLGEGMEGKGREKRRKPRRQSPALFGRRAGSRRNALFQAIASSSSRL